MPEGTADAVCWVLAVGLLALVVLLIGQRGVITLQRDRNAQLAARLRAWEEEVRHLVSVRLPRLEDVRLPSARDGGGPVGCAGSLIRAGSLDRHVLFDRDVPFGRAGSLDRDVPFDSSGSLVRDVPFDRALPFLDTGLLDARLADSGFAKCLDGVLERFSDVVEDAQVRAGRSARAALIGALRPVRELADEQQAAIARMQERHDDPDVLGDLFDIDHTNALLARRAQAVAVLCGSSPGRRRTSAQLVDVVRGAASRIRDYRRIRVNGEADLTVLGGAVDPVVLALAELLDNAVRHTSPDATVTVDVRPVRNGACVVVDDAGPGLDADASAYAAEVLSGRHPVDITSLGAPPRFGLAVIGALAARHGFAVSVDTRSPYGGSRAVVFLPMELLTPVASGAGPEPGDGGGGSGGNGTAGRRSEGSEGSGSDGTGGADGADGTGGLPRRRRRTPRRPSAVRAGEGVEAEETVEAEEAEGASQADRPGAPGRVASGVRTDPQDSAVRRPESPGRPAPRMPVEPVEPVEPSEPSESSEPTEGALKTDAVGEETSGAAGAGPDTRSPVGAEPPCPTGKVTGHGTKSSGTGTAPGTDSAIVRSAEENARRMRAFSLGLRRGRAEEGTSDGFAGDRGLVRRDTGGKP
ncbi:ATP-binding protein [Streptomyces sp. NPDC058274]|uniref:ATP-binding protein n=1 Tax=Streptomyces sp. NPDC058274 TaxID=3346416 RepID=UPI0036E34E3F